MIETPKTSYILKNIYDNPQLYTTVYNILHNIKIQIFIKKLAKIWK